ncbi:putative alpha-1,2-mannosidase [Rarobacter faecitabidus]|uniref:Putative alpha-1,2-mannosidase n=2 Tax=Rarobacter faecitabidus TaxID=13243 RepID=A0A542ZA18_RARFA|nr:putative alpha-1,2-mannosidase [Rarobacter faecitabidus]
MNIPARTRKPLAFLATLSLAAGLVPIAATPASAAAVVADPAAVVNPFVGTSNAGNTYPGAVAPFGMLAWSPDNVNTSNGTMRTATPSGYSYDSNRTRGFSLTHVSGAGCAGLSGDIPFFPYVGAISTSPSAADTTNATTYKADYAHANESASPGTYKVTLNNGVGVELAATTRTGSGRFTFPASGDPAMLIRTSDSMLGSNNASISIDQAGRAVSGWVESGNFCGSFVGDGSLQRSYYRLYFQAEFDQPFASVGTWTNGTVSNGSTQATGGTGYTNRYPTAGNGSGGFVRFAQGATVNVRVGISYVDAAGAAANLAAENSSSKTLEQVKAETKAAWNEELRTIEIGGGTESQQRTFYTALYHSLLHPNIIEDVDGRYPRFEGLGTDGSVAVEHLPASQDHQYTTFSGWDVYRSQMQLVAWLNPKRGSDLAQSLFNQAKQFDGVWDRWTHVTGATHVMVGDPSAVSVAGMYAFGARDFDVEGAYQSLKRAATVPTDKDLSRQGRSIGVVGQRPSLDKFLQYGYYPEGCNAWGCPNETLEMAIADYSLAALAQSLGHEDDYKTFAQRSQSWQSQYNPNATATAGYVQRRNADGSWVSGFDPSKDDGFVEATGATYVWMVQHNPAGLFEVMGGNEVADERLDGYFKDDNGNWVLTGSWNNHIHANMDNEPSVAVPWLYNYLGKPWKTQETVRETVKQLWLDPADNAGGSKGIPGNDDLGEMSSWLVFAALGGYPQNPARAELAIAAPLFETIRVSPVGGQTLAINAPGASVANKYIQSVSINGQASTLNYLPADLVTGGGTVDFALSTTANTSRGTAPSDAPPSERTGENLPELRVSNGSATAYPGSPASITLSARNLPWVTSSQTITFTVSFEDEISVDTTAGTLAVSGNSTVTSPLVVRPKWGTPAGTYKGVVKAKVGNRNLREIPITVTVLSGPQRGSAKLDTSFEVGQTQVPESLAVGTQNAVDTYCCSTNPLETKVAGDGEERTGTQSVVYAVKATGPNAVATNELVSGLSSFNEPISAGTVLSYSVYPQSYMSYFSRTNTASRNVIVDVQFSDGTFLSELAPEASNGAVLTPVAQAGVLTQDEWNDIAVAFPESTYGKTIQRVVFRFGTGAGSIGSGDGYARGWIDDLAIYHEIPDLIFSDATTLSGRVGDTLGGPLVKFTGGAGAEVADYSATVAWGDGDVTDASIVTSDGGYQVVAQHVYAAPVSGEAVVTVTDPRDTQATVSLPLSVLAKDDPGPGTDPGDGSGAGYVDSTVAVKAAKTKFGKAGSLAVTVSAPGVVPAGTVSALVKGRIIGSATLKNGKATIKTSKTLAVGTHQVLLSYSPAANVKVRPSFEVTNLKVAKVTAKVKAKRIKGKLSRGSKASVKVTVTLVAKAKATGKVMILVGKKVVGSAKVKTKGGKAVVTVKTKRLTKKGKITVKYAGNATYLKKTYKTSLRVK